MGFNAFSCDILESSGGHPEWHIKGDVIPHLYKSNLKINHLEGNHNDRWDLIISFPPCTDLTVSGARWFDKKDFQENKKPL
ncbi:MAG: hypothetical protein QOK89_06520 [Nitrososphaeraceae archaeon]|nr:hypothetical protein [Nitrososphaeraceae archaeon]